MAKKKPADGTDLVLAGQPRVELGEPVLDGVDGHDDQHRFGVGGTQEHVAKGHHLQRRKKKRFF